MPETPTALVDAIPRLEAEVSPEQFPEGGGYTVLLICAGVLMAAAAAALALWWRRRHAAPQPAGPESALERLQRLAAARPTLREAGLQVSLIVREYLQQLVQDPALYETHEEFSRRVDSLTAVPDACRHETRCLLEQLAELKYADTLREDAPARAAQLAEQACDLIRRIHEARQNQLNSPTKA